MDETSKIMLMNEFELLYWYYLMKKYLKSVIRECMLHCYQVKLFFFLTAMFVKAFLVKSRIKKGLERQRKFSEESTVAFQVSNSEK